ncbi:hypothetical protein [Lacticaseibacillus rhamnosus]|nr:hypothetical protein [Lacticaseibacillus rhamnosus]MCT3168929.1 hypothetical protein [Lacticaseibacillus rhamnosus]MCT3178463.1 hypothetical protein [Lacticaseibacillus rhamnosus]MCT3183915.1 hypothetical protein [Lacticaseibacillus rhamnosus]MCT4449553.1 hypothetical protein [Lacticaseibacillus rhamnosus]
MKERKGWTTKELLLLRKEAILAVDTNSVLNLEELAQRLGRSVKSVEIKISRLRKSGQFPKYDKANQFDKFNSLYTEQELRWISHLIKHHTYQEVAEITGRTREGIATICYKHNLGSIKRWTDGECELLIRNIKYDRFGIVQNYPELARLLDKEVTEVSGKVRRLRDRGILPRPLRACSSEPTLKRRADYHKRLMKVTYKRF